MACSGWPAVQQTANQNHAREALLGIIDIYFEYISITGACIYAVELTQCY